MNGREALKALADGKRVRHRSWKEPTAHLLIGSKGELATAGLDPSWTYEMVAVHSGPFEVLEWPATDQQLVAEMERLSSEFAPESAAAEVAQRCARMLRARRASP